MEAQAISTVVELLNDVVVKKVIFLRGVKKQIKSLKRELDMIRSFLVDANRRQVQEVSVRTWISQIREVCLDTEDVTENFNLNIEDLRRSRGLFNSCGCTPSYLIQLNIIGEEIESIRASLRDIDERRKSLGIIDLGESVAKPQVRREVEARRRLAFWHKDEDLVGLEDDVEKLLESIMDKKNEGLSVTAIVGMGGIGKSTLARELYNHPSIISGRFDCRAWVVVSSEFNPQETIKQLIRETTKSEEEKQKMVDKIKNLEESMKDGHYLESDLKKLLYERLEGKTYFIILDDVWNKEHWESLKAAFPREQDKRSRLLLTTRDNIVANHCQNWHEMKFLDREKSWKLFLNKGLNSNEEFPKDLESKGKDIVMKKCKGLPLAITLMGGLLAEKRNNGDWGEALDELNSNLGEDESSIAEVLEEILELSYHSLSPELKSCFLCLAFFKEDATIPVKKLINIMVGQGLIQQEGKPTTEEIARGYLEELINRNMVQIKDLALDNRVKSCQLHDSLHRICLKKAKEEIRLEIFKRDQTISGHKSRHCIVQYKDLGSFSRNENENENKYIRSLFLLNVEDDLKNTRNWEGFQYLKILDLDLAGFYYMERLPDSFKALLRLKELRIHTEYNCFIELPTWLNTLKRLEVLDMGALDVEFPNVPLKMDSLRHIHASSIHVMSMTNSWKNVETLKYVKQKDWIGISSKLMDGGKVRELGIVLDRVSSSVTVSLEKLENLVKLRLVWRYRLPIDAPVISHLRNLRKLKLGGVIRKCPSANMLPPNLLNLTLEWSYLLEDPMQELSKLRELLYLKLKDNSYFGQRMQVPRDGFRSLKGLSLQRLGSLRSVDIEDGGMRKLKRLQVCRCPHLDTTNLVNKSYKLQILADAV